MKSKLDYHHYFYKSVSMEVDAVEYKTVFEKDGINPMKMADDGDLKFSYAFASLLKSIIFFFFLL